MAEVSAGVLGKGPTSLRLRQTLVRRAVPEKCRGVRPCVSRLVHQCGALLCTRVSSVLMLRDRGEKWHQPAPLALDKYFHAFCSQGSTLRRLNILPAMCPRHFSDCDFYTVCLCVVCLTFLHENRSALCSLSWPRLPTFRTPGFWDMVWAGA